MLRLFTFEVADEFQLALLDVDERDEAFSLADSVLGVLRAEGQRRVYALDPRPLRQLDEWLEPYRDLWAQRLDALDTEIARGRRARRNGEPA